MLRLPLSLVPLLLILSSRPAVSAPQPAPSTISPTSLAQAPPGAEQTEYAQQITVRIKSTRNQGSGTLLGKQGNIYLVLTNAHVVRGSQTLSIQTHDGQSHTAQLIPNAFTRDQDLALIRFQSNQTYALAEIGTFTPKVGHQLFTGGYDAASGTFISTSSQVQQILPQPLQQGYQIGFSGNVAQGTSGGPILEATGGQLIGIQGRSAHPLIDDYTNQDGTAISAEQIKQLRQHNWGIPIQTVLAQIEPKLLVAYNLPTPNETATLLVKPNWSGWTAQLEQQAQQFTVRINSSAAKTSGSGVIIAKRGNTYTVLTAEHVLAQNQGSPSSFTLTTADGQTHPLSARRIRRQPGVDLAVVEFESKSNYAVATLANYRQSKEDKVFVAGFPKVGQSDPQWLMSSGSIFEQEQGRFRTSNTEIASSQAQLGNSSDVLSVTQGSFAQGYDLFYTSITYGGMSGGPVLDTQGRVIGIHGQAEAEVSGNSVIQLGNSLGIPIRTFLGLAPLLQVTLQPQTIATTTPAPLTQQQDERWRQDILSIDVPQGNAAPEVWIQRGDQLRRLGRLAEAIVAFDRAIELDRGDVYLAYFGKAQALFFQDECQQAVTALKEAIGRQPDYTPAWQQLAVNHRFLEQDAEALVAINRAIEQQPRNANLYNEKFLILDNLERHQESLVVINQALRLSERATFYSNRGSAYADLKQYPQAFADYNKAIALNPEDAKAYNNRGFAYLELKQYPQALADYNKAIALDPEYANAYGNRGNAYAFSKQYPQAIQSYDKFIALNPENVDAYMVYNNRGYVYAELKQYPQAFADYDKAITLDPKHAYAYNNRGNSYSDLKQYPQALADYNKAITLDPKPVKAYANRGNAYAALKQYPQAIQDYDKAINLNPKFVEAYYNRGNAYAALKQYPQALADYGKAINLNPKLVEAYHNRGFVYATLKQYPQAFADYNKAIAINPKFVETYHNRGNAYLELKQYPQAFSDFSKAITTNPKFVEAYIARGNAYFGLKQYLQALAEYDKAIVINPEYTEIYFNRGNTYALLKQYPQALADYDKFIAINPKFIPAIKYIGLVNYEQSNVNAAIAQFQKVISLDNSLAEPKLALATAYFKSGNQAPALELAKTALQIEPQFAQADHQRLNNWGEKLIADTQALLANPAMKSVVP
jgi:tetratricopeptide (TPR) repeat protein/S1-C subfamily serine protease